MGGEWLEMWERTRDRLSDEDLAVIHAYERKQEEAMGQLYDYYAAKYGWGDPAILDDDEPMTPEQIAWVRAQRPATVAETVTDNDFQED